MDRRQQQRAALFAAFLLFLTPPQVRAHPYPKDDIHDAGFSYLMPRACEQYCGSDNQFCCGAGSACFTENGIAKCAGGQNLLTTTWTETNTFTSTITTKWPEAAPTPIDKSIPCVPQSEGWSSCGWICCDWWQECGPVEGQCVPKPGFEDGPPKGSGTTTIVMTTDGHLTTLTTQFSAPFRVTGTGSPESTGGVGGEGQDDDGGTGLSGGAIAGIVVGTLAAICLLSFICFCCIAKGILGAIFGGKKKKERSREEIYEDKYTRRSSRPSSQHTKRNSHGSWFGSSNSTRHEPKKKSGGGMWLGIAGLAATMLALLNFRKSKKKPESRTPTMYTDSYMYTDSSPSSSSSGGGSKHPSRYSRRSDGRSHRSAHTQRTRQTAARSSRRSSAMG